jgi:hydrogenase 3 maturation protease
VGSRLAKREYNLEKELKKWFVNHGTVVVAGIGNPIRMDDFVGVKIVQGLQGKVPKNVHLIECETVPESFMDEIVQLKPSHVLLVDAAAMRLKPGEVRLFDAEKVTSFPAISTHMLPLRVFCEYITKMSGARLALLLIEPGNTEFGEGLTPEVNAATEEIVITFVKVLSKLDFMT